MIELLSKEELLSTGKLLIVSPRWVFGRHERPYGKRFLTNILVVGNFQEHIKLKPSDLENFYKLFPAYNAAHLYNSIPNRHVELIPAFKDYKKLFPSNNRLIIHSDELKYLFCKEILEVSKIKINFKY